jgi:hypothetical protein
MPVATFDRFTVADVVIGLMPLASRTLDDVGPKPMPSAPSTSDAAKPARPARSNSIIR